MIHRREVAPAHVLAVASLGVFMAFVDATILNVAFPDIQRSFPAADLAGLSWIFNAYNLVFAALLVVAGRIADLVGRRRVFRWSVALFGVASLLCALAGSPGFLIAARVLQAVAAAALVPTSLALVLEGFPADRRAHAVALWAAVAALAAGLGPSLGGLLVEVSGWRLAFLVNLPVAAATVVLAPRLLIESRAPGRRTLPDLSGALLLAGALGLVTFALVRTEHWGWTDPRVLGAAALSAGLAVAFVRSSARHASPVVDLELFRVRGYAVANALTVLVAAAFFANLLCCVLFLTAVWGYSPLEAGLAITPAPFVAAATAGAWGRLAEARGYRAALVPAMALYVAGVTLYLVGPGAEPDYVGAWLPAQIVTGVAAGAALPLLNSAAVAALPDTRFATAAAVNAAARQLGAVLGIALLVALVGSPAAGDMAAALDRGWTMILVALGTAVVGALALGRPTGAATQRTSTPDGPARPAPSARGRAIDRPADRRPARLPEDDAAIGPEDTLRLVPAFAALPEQQLAQLAGAVTTVELDAGTWLFRRGEAAPAAYVIDAGRVDVVADEGEQPGPVRQLGRGAVVGELALVLDAPRAMSVRARRDTRLLEIARPTFDELVESSPGFATAVARLLAGHLVESAGARSRTTLPGTVAVVPVTAEAPAAAFADALAGHAAAHERLTVLTGPPAGERAAALLDRCERRNDQVLLVAGAPPEPWTRFCLRQADRKIAVARAGDLAVADLELVRRLEGCELVVCGEADAATVAWWRDALVPSRIHRVDADLAGPATGRIARRLAGRSIGLVLSGGGARAFAHLGVLDELHAAGIAVERIGGTSMGALIGAMVALGMPPDEIDARCFDEWVRRQPLGDVVLPRRGLIAGDRVRAALHRTLGDACIEELPRDFFCVSADLLSGDLVVHRRGSLVDAVSASMAVPGLAAPVPSGRRLLVDGGVLNNLPADVMAAGGEGPVLAVDVTANLRPEAAPGAELPRLTETLSRVAVMASADTQTIARRHADLVINPAADGVGLFEFHQLDRMRDAGREAARQALGDAPSDVWFGSFEEALACSTP